MLWYNVVKKEQGVSPMGSEETAATYRSDEKGETSNTVRNASGTTRHVAWRKERRISLDCHALSDNTVF